MTQFSAVTRFFAAIPLPGVLPLFPLPHLSGKLSFSKQHSKNQDHDIWTYHLMANGEKVETVTDFIFLGPRITADGDYSHEIKRQFLLERKAMINLDSVLKSRNITLLTKVRLVRAVVFSSSHVWM